MARIVKQPDLVQMILELKARISKLENAPRLTASNIQTNGNSRLSVSNVVGQTVFQAGDLAGSVPGTVVSGIAVYRAAGTPAFTAASGAGAVQYGFNDQTGSSILQTNETSGYGLEDPSIPVVFYANDANSIPSTTSGTPGPMWLGGLNASHSLVDVGYEAAVSGGATGTISLVIDGVTVSTQTTTAAGFTSHTFTASISGANTKTQHAIAIYGSISAGAGTLQVIPIYCRLRGSLG